MFCPCSLLKFGSALLRWKKYTFILHRILARDILGSNHTSNWLRGTWLRGEIIEIWSHFVGRPPRSLPSSRQSQAMFYWSRPIKRPSQCDPGLTWVLMEADWWKMEVKWIKVACWVALMLISVLITASPALNFIYCSHPPSNQQKYGAL